VYLKKIVQFCDENMERKKIITLIVITVFYISFSVFIYSALLSPGIIVNEDLTEPRMLTEFVRQYVPLWNENGYSSIYHLSELGIYSPIFHLSNIVNILTVHVLFTYFIFLSTISGISMFLLTNFIFKYYFKDNYNLQIASFVSSFVYFASPYIIEQITHPAIRYAYSLAPLLLLFIFKALETDVKKYSLISGLLWSISCADTHWIFFGFLLFIWSMIYAFVSKARIHSEKKDSVKKLLKRYVMHLSIFLGSFLLFSSYFLLPAVLKGGASLYPNILTPKRLEIWFRNASPLNLFAMKGQFHSRYGVPPDILKGIYLNIFLYLISILGLTSLLFKTKRYKTHLSILYILTFILSAGPNLFEGFYNWFMFEAPFHVQYAWAFRTPKISQFMVLSIAPLVGFTYLEISEKSDKYDRHHIFKLAFLSMILISTIVPNYPFLTGDINGNLKTTTIPPDFEKINNWLYNQSENFKVFWAPQYYEKPFWNAHQTGPIAELLSEKTTYQGWNNYYFATLGIEFSFKSILLENASKHIEAFYSPLNVKYLIIHNDVPEIKSRVESMLDILKGQDNLEFVGEDGFIYVFKLNDYSEHIEANDNILFVSGGLRKYNSLTYAEGFNPISTAVIYGDFAATDIEQSNILVLRDPKDLMLSRVLHLAKILKPFDYTNHYNPEAFWSKTTLSSIEFRNELYHHGLESFEFDYGNGIVLTDASNTLKMFFITQTTGTYELYMRYFQNNDGGKMALYLDGKPIKIIDTKDQINRFTWKKIGTYNLDREKHTLTLENREGFNAVNLFALIPQEEAAKTEERVESLIQKKRIIYILEAESDMYEENSPTSNKYGGEASNGEVIELTPTSRVWNQLEVLKPGNYTIVIRGKGNLNVKIDGNEYTANSAQLDWTYLGPVSLEKGKHEIEITPSSMYSQPSDLDVVWIYSTQKENETLEEIFTPKENPVEIIGYQKIDPTKYIVEVNATKPFMLSFAEAHDPLWIAHVNGERIESIPLYSVINGFWINQTGQLEITIEYEPQKWFYYGSIISVTTFLACLTYITYNWTKNKAIWKRTKRTIARVRLILHLNRRKKKIQHKKA